MVVDSRSALHTCCCTHSFTEGFCSARAFWLFRLPVQRPWQAKACLSSSQPTHFIHYTALLAHEDIPPLGTLHSSSHSTDMRWGCACRGRGGENREGEGEEVTQKEHGHQSLIWGKNGARNHPPRVFPYQWPPAVLLQFLQQTQGMAPFPGKLWNLIGRPEPPRT